MLKSHIRWIATCSTSVSRAVVLEDPWVDASGPELADMYKLSVAPEDAPDVSEYLELEFERGLCVALGHKNLQSMLGQLGFDGDLVKTEEGRIRLSPLWVMKVLNILGGRNGDSDASIWSKIGSSA